ncbi:MAG: hypothetical protein J5726_00390 [Treponema sp.]|nr:hypothetical protein [Treponema sp.]
MKKLFLAFIVLAAFVLASCGSKDMSYRNGDVSFSISGSEVGRYLAARNTDGSADDKIEFAILVQIKGSKGYYAWQMGKAYYTPESDSVEVPEGVSNPVTTDGVMVDLPEEIQTHVESLIFPFKHIPANQTYNVAVDIFKKGTDSADAPHSFPDAWSVSLSGEKSEIRISAGSSTPVTVELEDADEEQNNFALKVSYEKNNQPQTELISLDQETLDKYKFSHDDEYVYFSHAGREWYTLTDFKLVLDSSSHFSKGAGFSFVKKNVDATGAVQNSEKIVTAQSTNGEIELLSMSLGKEEGTDAGLYKTIELDFEGIVLYQYLNLYIGAEKENFGNFSAYEHNYNFVKDTQASDDSKLRFVMTIPLEEIFGEEPLAKGDSIAFLLNSLDITRSDNGESVTSNQLAYQLQKSGWEQDNPTKRYASNTTIDVNNLSDSLVLASNFIEGDEKYLQIYVDLEKSFNSVNELNADFGINYKVFPASDKVYIFYTNYDLYSDPETPAYRFDMNIKLNSYLKASGRRPVQGNKVTVPVGGTFYWVGNFSKTIPEDGHVYGNFIDNAGYKDEGSTEVKWYHNLSGEMNNEIKTDGSIDDFIFDKIMKPHEKEDNDEYFVDNDFSLQCYYRLGDEDFTSNLFIIENFSIGASVSGDQVSIWDFY